MDRTAQAHLVTHGVIVATMMIAPGYVLATYTFSRASPRKGLAIGAAFAVWGGLMSWVCLETLPLRLGLPGNLIVPAAWLAPSLISIGARRWVVSERLSQRWLVGLQVFRVIGGVFLIEMARGRIPAVFAYPAGLGDLLVGFVAAAVLVRYRRSPQLPPRAVATVLWLGLADFAWAFFFGFTSNEGPLQLFARDFENRLLLFPTGMIPLFLVPYALFFHTLSWLSLRRPADP